jgi:hypothetical protein
VSQALPVTPGPPAGQAQQDVQLDNFCLVLVYQYMVHARAMNTPPPLHVSTTVADHAQIRQ